MYEDGIIKMGLYYGRTVYMPQDETDYKKPCKDEAVDVKNTL